MSMNKKSKKSKSKKTKIIDDDSLSFSLDDESGKSNLLGQEQHSQPQINGMGMGMGSAMGLNMDMGSNLQNNTQAMSNIMLPDPNLISNVGMVKMKQGTNSNFNQIFQNLNKDGLVPVLPEMQQYFDLNQISKMPQKEFSSEVQYGNEPKIMDSGLLSKNYGMKKQLPLVNDPSLASIAGLNQFGMNMGMGSAMGSAMGMNFGTNEFGTNDNSKVNAVNVNASSNDSNILKGGNKNKIFFLKKK
jgi:hypothetical protein